MYDPEKNVCLVNISLRQLGNLSLDRALCDIKKSLFILIGEIVVFIIKVMLTFTPLCINSFAFTNGTEVIF